MNGKMFTLTLQADQILILNDVLWEALHGPNADDEERNAYVTLQRELQAQLDAQRETVTA